MLELEKKILRELTAAEADFVAGGTGAGCYPTDTTIPPETTTITNTTYTTDPLTLTTTTTVGS